MRALPILVCCICFSLINCLPPMVSGAPLLRISVENNDTHVQAKAVQRFADKLKERLNGSLDVQFASNATMFRDQDVIKAMVEGKVEMAVPGTWHVARFEPNVGIFLLPYFYNQPPAQTYRLLESPAGRQLIERIEKAIPAKVIGRWIDLGYTHLFSLKKAINNRDDLAGMRVRVAGGEGNMLRIQAIGGKPTIVAWPDLPEFLTKGKIDAILTSYETVRSGSLWQYGISYCYEDSEYFPQYVPLIRSSFWRKLSAQQQQIILDTWDEDVDTARIEAAQAQADAKNEIVAQGVKITVPDKQEEEQTRKILLQQQQRIIEAMGLDQELVRTLLRQ